MVVVLHGDGFDYGLGSYERCVRRSAQNSVAGESDAAYGKGYERRLLFYFIFLNVYPWVHGVIFPQQIYIYMIDTPLERVKPYGNSYIYI